jgi:hypothetical protein
MSRDRQVIKNYESNERMMVLLYAQWCRNHDLSPVDLYEKAYPNQPKDVLLEMMEWTVPKEEADAISNETLLSVLQTFGNDDLAFVIHEQVENQKKDD